MIRRVNIGLRLSLVLGTTVVLLLIMGITGINRLSELNSEVETIAEHRAPSLKAVNDIYTNFLLMRVNLANVMSKIMPKDQVAFFEAFEVSRDAKDEAVKEFAALIRAVEAQNMFDELNARLAEYEGFAAQIADMASQGRLSEATNIMDTQAVPTARAITQAIDELATFQEARTDSSAANARAAFINGRLTLILSMVVIALLVIAGSWLLTRSIVLPIRRAVQAANRIANDDLNVEISVDGNDEAAELLRALSQMRTNLHDAISQISSSADQLAASAEELNAVTDESNKGLQLQSEELEMAASAVNELTTAIEDVARNASETADESREADNQTHTGLSKVEATVSAIESLVTDIQANASSTEELAKRVTEVASVLDVIRN
ncbi:MAG: methyl-accepting chemotaxis protein, partial [Natronospirillum sp.]